jgi:hypothetical protein
MRNVKIQRPVLISRQNQYEFETLELASTVLQKSSSSYPKTVVEVAKFVSDKLSGADLSQEQRSLIQPAFREKRDLKGVRGMYLTSLADPKGILPVSEIGCNTMIAYSVNDLWFSEFLDSGVTFASLAAECVASRSSLLDQKTKNLVSSLNTSMSTLRQIRESSENQEVGTVFLTLVSSVVANLCELVIPKGTLSITNDPFYIALSLLNRFVKIIRALVVKSDSLQTHTSTVYELPEIVSYKQFDQVVKMYKAYKIEEMAKEMRQTLTSFKFSELASFNQWNLSLGFTATAKLKMSSIFIKDVYNTALKAFELMTQCDSFLNRIESFCSYTILDSAYQRKVVPESVRIMSTLVFNKDVEQQFSIKRYDVEAEMSKFDSSFISFVDSFADYVKTICYVNPKVTDIYSAQLFISEASAVNQVIRVCLSSRFKKNYNILRIASKKPDTSLQPVDDVYKLTNYEFEALKESTRDNVVLQTSRNFDVPGSIGTTSNYSIVCEGFTQEFRNLVEECNSFFEVNINENDVDYRFRVVTSAYSIKPNHRYNKFVFGKFFAVSDKFVTRSLDLETCDNVELFFAFSPEEVSNGNLLGSYEKRIADFISNDDRIVRSDISLCNPPSVVTQYSNLSRFIQVQSAMSRGSVGPLGNNFSYISDRFASQKINGNNYSLLASPEKAFPKKTTIPALITLSMFLPLKFLSEGQIELISSYPSHAIQGPILAQSNGLRIWRISIASNGDVPVSLKSQNLPDASFLKLTFNFNYTNLSFGDRNVYRVKDGLSVALKYDDPYLNKIVKYGNTFVYGADGVIDARDLLVNFEPTMLNSRSGEGILNPSVGKSSDSRYSSVMLLYYKLLANYYMSQKHLWLKNGIYSGTSVFSSIVSISKTIAELLRSNLSNDVFVMDLGGITACTLGKLLESVDSIANAVTEEEACQAIEAFTSNYDGENLKAAVLYNFTSYSTPGQADFKACEALSNRDPYIPFVRKPTIIDSVELPGLDGYLSDEVVRAIADCIYHSINDFPLNGKDIKDGLPSLETDPTPDPKVSTLKPLKKIPDQKDSESLKTPKTSKNSKSQKPKTSETVDGEIDGLSNPSADGNDDALPQS